MKEVASDSLFEMFFDAAPIASAITSIEDGRIAIANEAFSKLVGISKGDLLGKTTIEILLWADPLQRKRMIELLKEKGSLYNHEIQVRDSNGITHQCLLSAEIINYNSSNHLLTQAVDISASNFILHKALDKHNMQSSYEYVSILLRNAIEEIPLGITITDLADRIVFINSAEANMYGYSVEELLGESIAIFSHKRNKESSIIIQERNPWTREAVTQRKDGSKIILELTSTIFKDSLDIPIGVITVSKDISDRKKLQERLRLLDKAIDTSVNAFAFSDLEGNLIYVNKSFLSTWGYNTESEVFGRKVTEFWSHNEGAEAVIFALQRDGHWSGELEAKRKNGSLFTSRISSSLVLDEEGKPVSLMGFFLDVTKEKAIVEILKTSRERLKLALDGAKLGLWDWNIKTGVVYHSKYWGGMIGYKPDEIEPNIKAWEKLVHPDDKKMVMETLENHLSGKTPNYETEHRLKAKDGSWIWVLDTGQVVEYDEDGKPLRAAGIHRDISYKKKLEEELIYNASTDALTDIPNRRAGLSFLEKHMQLSKRNKSSLSICYVDVDNLKTVNDKLGHDIGDLLIKAASTILKSVLREADMVCRLGGDEFLMILPNCTISQAQEIWERVKHGVNINNAEESRFILCLSHGIAEYNGHNSITVDEFVSIADEAMYKNKQKPNHCSDI